MSLYTFSDTSSLKEVAFHHAADRPPIALLETGTNSDPTQLSTIHQAICEAGWHCVPVSVDGKEVLQVSGFEKEQQLLNLMQKHHFSDGMPQVTKEAGDHSKLTAQDWLESSSLKTAGWLNLLGDATLLISGVMNKDKSVITAGSLFTAGAGVLARYGNVKTERQLRQVSENTAAFLQKQAIDLPDHCSLAHVAKNAREGLITSAESFLYRYPSEVMLGAYTLGAAAMLQSGIRHSNAWGIAYGANSLATKAASLVITEKHKTEEEKLASANQGPMGKLMDWVQEKPLRVFGFGSLVSDVLLGLSAMKDYKNDPKQRGYIFKFITTGSYIIADLLFAISHKNPAHANGKFDEDEQRYITGLAAEAIARQPKAAQAALVQNVAGFLMSQAEVNGTPTDIAAAIHEQITHIDSNPWTRRAGTTTLGPPVTTSR